MYICETPDLECDECLGIIPIGAEFQVISTPSKPNKNNCLPCAEKRLDSERFATADNADNVAYRERQRIKRKDSRLKREAAIRAIKARAP